jgi:hypothetical protein
VARTRKERSGASDEECFLSEGGAEIRSSTIKVHAGGAEREILNDRARNAAGDGNRLVVFLSAWRLRDGMRRVAISWVVASSEVVLNWPMVLRSRVSLLSSAFERFVYCDGLIVQKLITKV